MYVETTLKLMNFYIRISKGSFFFSLSNLPRVSYFFCATRHRGCSREKHTFARAAERRSRGDVHARYHKRIFLSVESTLESTLGSSQLAISPCFLFLSESIYSRPANRKRRNVYERGKRLWLPEEIGT